MFSEETMREVLRAYREKLLAKEGILPLLTQIASGSGFSPDLLPKPCADEELGALIAEAETEFCNMKLHHPEKEAAVLLGLVMGKVRGRRDGSEVARRLMQGRKEARP